jgi:hypothetical protein
VLLFGGEASQQRSHLLNPHPRRDRWAAVELIWVRYDEKYSRFYPETINNKIMTLAAELCVPLTIYQTIDSVDTKLEHPSEFVNKDKLGAYREYLEFIKTHSNKGGCDLLFYWRFVVNKGGEAPGYMEYILQRFDTLPEWMVFLHGRPDQHSRWWYYLLRCLDSKHLAHRGHPFYLSLNDAEYYKENVGIHMNVGQGLKLLYELWEIADVLSGMPKLESLTKVSLHPSAQFLVNRAAVKAHPRVFYEAALSASLSGYGISDDKLGKKKYRQSNQRVNWSGVAFEHLWHVVFGQLPRSSRDRCLASSQNGQCPVHIFANQGKCKAAGFLTEHFHKYNCT